jgi:hypothetical protein
MSAPRSPAYSPTSPTYSPTEMSDEACAICMCTIDSRDRDILTCGHAFCSGCITCWLDANTKCPLCRADPVLTRLEKSNISNVRINMTGFDHFIPRQLELSGVFAQPAAGARQTNWVKIAKEAATTRVSTAFAQQFLINNADKDTTENVAITREQLVGGERYFIVHPEFDVPECEGGDPRTRGIRTATCQVSSCPCKSFVAKILIFPGKFVIYQPEGLRWRRMYKSQHLIINAGQRDEHMVYAQGAIFRSQIVEWSHATIPVKRGFDFSDIIVPPPPAGCCTTRSANRRHPNCPFAIGQRVIKLRGVGANEEGIVIFIDSTGTKINVAHGPSLDNWRLPRQTWHLQRFSNYRISENTSPPFRFWSM